MLVYVILYFELQKSVKIFVVFKEPLHCRPQVVFKGSKERILMISTIFPTDAYFTTKNIQLALNYKQNLKTGNSYYRTWC